MRLAKVLCGIGIAAASLVMLNASCGDEPGTGPESGVVALTAPDCGETFAVGGTLNVTWTETSLANVNKMVVKLVKNSGGSTTLGDVAPGVLSFSYTLTSAEVSDGSRVIVVSGGGDLADTSTVPISIVDATVKHLATCGTATTPITLLYPVGGETFNVGDVVEVKYAVSSTFGYTQVVVKLATNEGLDPYVDLNSQPIFLPVRTYLWTVQSNQVGNCLLQVGDYGNHEMDATDNPVTVAP